MNSAFMILEYLWIRELTKIQTIFVDLSIEQDLWMVINSVIINYDACIIEFGSSYQIFKASFHVVHFHLEVH